MLRTRILFCLPFALLACEPAYSGPVITYSPCAKVMLMPASDTTSSELASITAAITLWREAGLDMLTSSEQPEGSQVPVQFKDAAAPFHGLYEPASGVVLINRGLEGEARDITLAHEVGHALGLPHVDASTRRSVMNPGNLTIHPSPEDQAELMRSCP